MLAGDLDYPHRVGSMYRTLILTEAPMNPAELRADLEAVGFPVIDNSVEAGGLAQAVIKTSPDVVVVRCRTPSDSLFEAAQSLGTLAPCPIVVFTSDARSSHSDRAVEVGIQAYVVDGYARHRLVPIMHIACARFRRERALRNELTDLSLRLEERKHIERAKGVLMRSRGITEDEAFDVLRNLAMSARQRIGEVAPFVIDASNAGEVVDKAGQLRMLSQRVVRCYAQGLIYPDHVAAAQTLSACLQRVEKNIAFIEKAISSPGFQELLSKVSARWQEVLAMLERTADASGVHALDELAEKMLDEAEILTTYLESSGLTQALYVLNVAGRQRMLSQRITKLCFLLALDPSAARVTQLRQLTDQFDTAMAELSSAPLRSAAISRNLEVVRTDWALMRSSLGKLQEASVLSKLAQESDVLLASIDRLIVDYQHAMQVLLGGAVSRLRSIGN